MNNQSGGTILRNTYLHYNKKSMLLLDLHVNRKSIGKLYKQLTSAGKYSFEDNVQTVVLLLPTA
jgi:hypothetical protein